MEVFNIKSDITIDMTYNKLVSEYSSIFNKDLDQDFTNLVNTVYEYLLYQSEDLKNQIKIIISRLLKSNLDEILNKNYTASFTKFDDDNAINLRLSRFIPTFIKMRQIGYQKAYLMASAIITGEIPDYKLYEDFNLMSHVLNKFTFENFYADVVVYGKEENLNRFYNECDLVDLIIGILSGENIDREKFDKLEKYFGKSEEKLFRYLKKRFLIRSVQKRKD